MELCFPEDGLALTCPCHILESKPLSIFLQSVTSVGDVHPEKTAQIKMIEFSFITEKDIGQSPHR